jgi:hypothetical protein
MPQQNQKKKKIIIKKHRWRQTIMPTLIRTLTRIKPPPPLPPPLPPPKTEQPRPREEYQKIAHRQNNSATLSYYDIFQLRKSNEAEAAVTLASMNKKSTDNTTLKQKDFTADTSNDTKASMSSDAHSNKKRKSSSVGADYEELVLEKRARSAKKNKSCAVDGCEKFVVNRGVCVSHGAILKRCSSEGCKNQAQRGGVCRRHGAEIKQCSIEGCNNQAKKKGLCRRHGAFR